MSMMQRRSACTQNRNFQTADKEALKDDMEDAKTDREQKADGMQRRAIQEYTAPAGDRRHTTGAPTSKREAGAPEGGSKNR